MSELTVQRKVRLLSLDVFRGATMAAMILVNNPGGPHAYAPLEHADWNGWTPTDLIFPFFLFMVGVSIVFSMQSRKTVPGSHGKLILNAFRRMVTILAINYGMRLLFNHHLSTLRIPGVLPRIAVVYFICTVLYVTTSANVRNWILALVLIGYYFIMNFIPVPGVGHPSLEPSTNLGAWIDRLVFGTAHLWNESKTWDPEGLLSTLPAIGTGLIGIMAGRWLKRTDREASVKVSWMLTYGVIAVVLGLIWNWFFPINKKLWTSSFVLLTGGLGTVALAVFYWLIDAQGHKRFTRFFAVFGTNAITAYILADLVPELVGMIRFNDGGHKNSPFGWMMGHVFSPHLSAPNASLAGALLLVLVIWLILWPLYRREIIIKV